MTDQELMQQALEALTAYDGTNGASQRKRVLAALRERLAQPQMQPCAGRNCGSTNPNLHSAECFEDYEKSAGMAQPVALESVYETIIHWDEGGGQRSRRELARRIVALYTTPPAQRTWVDPNDKTQKQYLPHIGEPVLFCHKGATYMGKHTGGSFQSEATNKYFNTWECHWMYLPAAHGIKEQK